MDAIFSSRVDMVGDYKHTQINAGHRSSIRQVGIEGRRVKGRNGLSVRVQPADAKVIVEGVSPHWGGK